MPGAAQPGRGVFFSSWGWRKANFEGVPGWEGGQHYLLKQPLPGDQSLEVVALPVLGFQAPSGKTVKGS